MNRITAQIALIAYLMGGWILPAIHHHGSTCDHAHHAAVSDAGTEGDDHDHSHSHASCTHDHNHSVPPSLDALEVSTSSLSTDDSQPTLVAYPTWNCTGLCALCVSRTLSTTKPIHAEPIGFDTAKIERIELGNLNCPLAAYASNHSPRGPPSDLV